MNFHERVKQRQEEMQRSRERMEKSVEKMNRDGERLEKFVKFFIAFVFIMIVLIWIGQTFIAMYVIKNPDIIGGWLGDFLQGLIKGG